MAVKKKTTKTAKTKATAVKSSDTTPQVKEIVNLIGQKIAGLRRAQGLSLQKLADKSDVSAPSIHKIERNGMVPTITTILKLGGALGVPVSYFVHEDESDPDPVHFTRAKERSEIYTPHKGLKLAGITGSYKQFDAAGAIATMSPKANSGRKLLKHPGEELVYIKSGEIIFQVGSQEYGLKPGDSLHFSGEIPHRWRNTSSKAAELIWIALRKS